MGLGRFQMVKAVRGKSWPSFLSLFLVSFLSQTYPQCKLSDERMFFCINRLFHGWLPSLYLRRNGSVNYFLDNRREKCDMLPSVPWIFHESKMDDVSSIVKWLNFCSSHTLRLARHSLVFIFLGSIEGQEKQNIRFSMAGKLKMLGLWNRNKILNQGAKLLTNIFFFQYLPQYLFQSLLVVLIATQRNSERFSHLFSQFVLSIISFAYVETGNHKFWNYISSTTFPLLQGETYKWQRRLWLPSSHSKCSGMVCYYPLKSSFQYLCSTFRLLKPIIFGVEQTLSFNCMVSLFTELFVDDFT